MIVDDAATRLHRAPASDHPVTAARFAVAIWIVIAAQAAWVGTLMSFGWYYQADFSNLADATGQSLSWHYLSAAQGGHFSVVSRTIFWLFQRTVGLNYPVTIAVRLVAQAVCTWLLARLLSMLVGRRPGVVIIVGLYAVSPLLLDGLLWFTPSAGVIGAEAAVLVALIAHIKYFRTRSVRWAVLAAAGIFAAALQADVTAAAALLLPALTLGFLAEGPLTTRVRALVSCWREWALIGTPMVAFLLYFFFIASYGKAAHPVGAADLAKVVGETWTATTVPSMLGGPWTWHDLSTGYIPISGPTWTVRAICLAVLVAIIIVSIRRTGFVALLAWAMPLGIAAVTVIVVALGRFSLLGLRIAHDYEYHFYTAVPAALGVCLAFMHRPSAEPATDAPRASRSATRSRRRLSPATSAVAVVVLAGSLVSAVTYTHRWAQNPSASYVSHLRAGLQKDGPGVNLFDSPLPSRMVPLLEPNHYVSDVVGLIGLRAQFDAQSSTPRLVSDDGDIVPASFFANTKVDTSGDNTFCNYLLTGATTTTRSLLAPVARNEWFLHLTFFQQHASVVYVSFLDRDGQVIDPRGGPRVILAGTLGSVYLPMLAGAPVAVRIRSTDKATNVCFTAAQVGSPFPSVAK